MRNCLLVVNLGAAWQLTVKTHSESIEAPAQCQSLGKVFLAWSQETGES